MTCLTAIHTEAAIPFFNADAEYLAALNKAMTRAAHSYFDQHIIRMDDGCCWVADDGDYEGWLDHLADRIVRTIPADLKDG